MSLPHAVHTEDEDPWVDFSGAVPRIGDIVCLIDSKEHRGKGYRVTEVRWFILSRGESQARVIIEEFK